jgi:hypothetical protein
MAAALSFLMIDELGILPQSSIKRTRRSRATLVESAIDLPIRGTSLCRISRPQCGEVLIEAKCEKKWMERVLHGSTRDMALAALNRF